MTIRTKIIKLIEHPNAILARLNGIKPLYAYYMSSIKKATSKNFKTIIDVGANDGLWSKAARYYYPQANIYIYEPIREKAEKLNSVRNSKVFSFALWDKNDKSLFNILDEGYDDHSSFLEFESGNSIYDERKSELNFRKIEVERKRFDSLNLEIKRPCLVKIDTEGTEIHVLEGFGKRLKEVDVLQIETNFKNAFKGQTKLSELITYLEKYGFTSFIQTALRYTKGSPCQCDLIFLRQ
ncbi:MAG TPA: FkbM family methyltransferase [Candidatus Nanoarchaeia archaeon]|nr:FkbM family methyltransferase [Candidatus Nanoarchaeia archaeon]